MILSSSLSQAKVFHILAGSISSFKIAYCTCMHMARHSWCVLSHAEALFPFCLPFPPTLHYSMICYTVSVQEAAPRGFDLQSNETAKSEKLCPTHKVQQVAEWPLCSNVTLLLFLSCLLNYNLCDTQIENRTPTCCIQSAFVISVLCTYQVSQCFFYYSVTIVHAFHISLVLLLQLVNTTSIDSQTLHLRAQGSEKENLQKLVG